MIDWDALVLAPTMGIFGEGQLPTYSPASGGSFPLPDAVFDREYLLVTTDGEGTENNSRWPVLGVRLARFAEAGAQPPRQNDKVYIPSVGMTFIVSDVRPDGHGHVLLMLMVTTA